MGEIGERDSAEGEARPEAGRDVADFARLAVSDRNEELNQPGYGLSSGRDQGRRVKKSSSS